MLRAGVIGKDGRTSAIVRSLQESRHKSEVIVLPSWKEPADHAIRAIVDAARTQKLDFVVVGPEAPLVAGIVDELARFGIPAVGPTRACAQLEASKSFTRELVERHGIPGNPRHRIFRTFSPEIKHWLHELVEFVVKPDGLTGGKGVRVSGDHLHSVEEGEEYCRELLAAGAPVVVEERLEGEEFSLQSFSDGRTLVHMPAVQDHKRAFEGDRGPNTGGMGSYSAEDHKLPFLSHQQLADAQEINKRVADAIRTETGEPYRGVLYGGFMATHDGVRLIEYNVRFGDPEALNILPLLETDFGDLCSAIVQGSLQGANVTFRRLATVCKYLVPKGYPEDPVKGEPIDLTGLQGRDSSELRIYKAAVEERDGKTVMTGSRAVAVVGLGATLDEAFAVAENAAALVRGPVFFRHDIGSAPLVMRRVTHMRAVMDRSVRA